jgi:periplasmic protein TonB
MFDSIRTTSSGQRSRFGVGSILSIAVHVGLGALVLVLTTRPAPVKEELPTLIFHQPLVKRGSPVATPSAAPAPPQQKRPAARRDRILPPKVIPTETVVESTPQPDPGPTIGVEIGGPAGPSGEIGSTAGNSETGTVGPPGGAGEDRVKSWEGGMTRPSFDRGELFRNIYTREALEAGVQGTMIIQCAVLADGSVRSCRPLKPLPFLTDAVITRLEHSRVAPATFQGAAVSVNYVFNFSFSIPR